MIKHLAILISFLLTVGTPATSADTVCTLSSSVNSSAADDPDKLIIRRNDLNIKAILMTKYSTKMYNCTNAIVDEYECFGFHDKPFEAPMQLNVGDTKAGATVVAATLNLGFLGAYAAGGYTPSDYITRRFSIDSYTIESCE